MLSERGQLQWSAYVRARGAGNALIQADDELNRFLVGVHMRGEALSAAELGALLDEAGADAAERDKLVDRIRWGLTLLAAHTYQIDLEDAAYTEVHEYGGFEI